MDREIRKSGLNLVLAGLLGLLFFWLTDPVHGIGHKTFDNPVDAMNEASLGTLAGILGSTVTYGYGAQGRHGANYIQTTAASVAGMSAMAVVIQAMTWLGLPQPPISTEQSSVSHSRTSTTGSPCPTA